MKKNEALQMVERSCRTLGIDPKQPQDISELRTALARLADITVTLCAAGYITTEMARDHPFNWTVERPIGLGLEVEGDDLWREEALAEFNEACKLCREANEIWSHISPLWRANEWLCERVIGRLWASEKLKDDKINDDPAPEMMRRHSDVIAGLASVRRELRQWADAPIYPDPQRRDKFGIAGRGPSPILAAYVQRLDEIANRIVDTARTQLIRRHLEGRLTDEQSTRLIAELEADAASEIWDPAEIDVVADQLDRDMAVARAIRCT